MSAILSAITLRGLLPIYAVLLYNALLKIEQMASDQKAIHCIVDIIRTSVQESRPIHDDIVEVKPLASANKLAVQAPSKDLARAWVSACGLSASDQEKLSNLIRQSEVEVPIDRQRSVRSL